LQKAFFWVMNYESFLKKHPSVFEG
jgi:hypothetical protein